MIVLFLFHILSYDIWFYVSHLLLHTKYLYWIHKIHHEKKYPTFLDTYHDHWIESPIQGFGFVIPMMFMETDLLQSGLALVVINARGILQHDKRGSWLVGNHHLLHHEYGHGNYGTYWIDYCCGTLLCDKRPQTAITDR
jgi:sterol desaturase/sphingolipid hydroxylase (fatty acid hydroxylase superfamily)